MPENSEQEAAPNAAELEDVLQALPSKPWLERDQWYVCRVEMGGEDHVELLAVSGRITEHLGDLLDMVSSVVPEEDTDATTIDVLQGALSQGLPDQLWDKIDQLLTEHIRDWDLSTWAEKTGRERPPHPPSDHDPDERMELLKSLPIPVMARLIYGLAWHSGNF